MAVNIQTLEELKELVVLEQFRESVPKQIATYVMEHRVSMVSEARVLLAPFGALGYVCGNVAHEGSYSPSSKDCLIGKRHGPHLRICNYCQGHGHWRDECPMLKAKGKAKVDSVKLIALLSSVQMELCSVNSTEDQLNITLSQLLNSVAANQIKSYGALEKKILLNSKSVLPFSESDTGDCVFAQGFGLTTLAVPLHEIKLECDVVQGEVVIGTSGRS